MQSKFEQLLDYLVNEETDKANELFHEIVVEKSRQIYENLLDEEQQEEDMDESSEVDEDDSAVEENFEEESVYEIGGDPTDDMVNDVEMSAEEGEEGDEEEFGDEEEGEEMGGVEDDIYDIKSDLEELKAEIEKLVAATPGADSSEDEMKVAEEDDVLREYVDKVAAPSNTSEKSTSPVAGKNDMGGTAVKTGGGSPEAGGKVAAPKVDDAGNGNVPGGKMGIKNLSKVSGGHGAEKKGSGESAGNKNSIIGG